jgi:hypothetical protein
MKKNTPTAMPTSARRSSVIVDHPQVVALVHAVEHALHAGLEAELQVVATAVGQRAHVLVVGVDVART